MSSTKSFVSLKEKYDRVVVLIDMDCFYCQVEEFLDEKRLKNKPIGEFRNFLKSLVTSNSPQLLCNTWRTQESSPSITLRERSASLATCARKKRNKFVPSLSA